MNTTAASIAQNQESPMSETLEQTALTSRVEPDQQVAVTPGSMLAVIQAAATNPMVDVAKMEALLNIQFRLEEREAERAFNEAYHRLQMDLPRIKKDGSVEYKGKEAFTFATWEAIDASLRPLLQREGFHLSFDTAARQGDGGGIIVTGTLHHLAGHKQSASIPLALDGSGGKNSIQGMGSTFSYGKRYTTTALLNIITEGEDDSGVRGGTVYITAAQKEQLVTLMQEVKADTVAYLRFLGVPSLDEVEERNFPAALNALNLKKSKLSKEANG